MSLVLLDGCEDFSSVINSGFTIVTGRNGNCFRNGTTLRWELLPAAQLDTITFGCAFRYSGTISASGPLIKFKSDAGATDHGQFLVQANGQMSFQALFAQIAISATGLIDTANRWYYIEIQFKLGDSPNGSVTVKLDGATVMTATNVDTKNSGTKTVLDSVELANPFNGPSYYEFDDVYIEAATGTGDPFLGDMKIETLYPNGNGNANQWTGSDGDSTNNYLLVDESGTPVLTDYVYSATVGQQDLYALTDLVSTTGTVVGVCHSAHALRTDSVTARSIKLVNRRAADNKSASHALQTTYRSYDHALTLDPETGVAWTIANVNALQSGIELA